MNLPYIDDPRDTFDKVSESKAIFYWLIKKSNRMDMLSYDIDQMIKGTQLQGVIDDLSRSYRMPCYQSKSKEELVQNLNEVVPNLTKHKWTGLSEALGKRKWLLGKKIRPIDFMFVELI